MSSATPTRRRAPLLATLLLATALVGVVAFGARGAEAKPKPEFFGVVPTTVKPGDLAQMSAHGVGMVRHGLFWPAIEPTPGAYDWTAYDFLFREATKAGVRVFPTLFGTPGWVNFLAGQNACGAICAPEAAASRQSFADFAVAAVKRYGPEGDFWKPSGDDCGVPSLCPSQPAPCECTKPLPVLSWQIWNEQNSPKYYAPDPDPIAYAAIVNTVGSAIKSVDPRADIVIGGMWGPPDTDAVVHTVEYLRQMYSVPNVEAAFDSIAVHPYAPTLAGVEAQMKRVRKAVKRLGDPAVRTWVTELGWASGGPRSEGLVKTPKAQARLLRESYEMMIAKRKAWKLRGVQWYTWRDAGPGESDCAWCPEAGLLTQGGKTKAAGRAFRRLALGL